MTRILLFLDSSGLGGIESHVATLAEGLPERGVPAEILFWRDYPGNAFETRLKAAGLPLSSLDGRFSALVHRLRRERSVLLHTHGYKAGILGRLAAKLVGIPVVSTYHAGERGRFPVNLYQALDSWTGWLAEGIAVSPAIARQLPFKATVIPNFVHFPPLPLQRLREPQIGFVGRLSPEKAPDRFVKLAETLGGNASFHVFGDGPMRAGLMAGAAGNRILWHGMVTDPGAIWPSLDLLIMPSRAEGLPMAALEALAAGIPIIGTRVGALPSVIGNSQAGWLVEEGPDEQVVADMAQAAKTWLSLSGRERDSLRTSAHDHGARHFGLQTGLTRVIEAYRRAGA
jgi:glycosyltransferase involved in cell wall biosynthesis